MRRAFAALVVVTALAGCATAPEPGVPGTPEPTLPHLRGFGVLPAAQAPAFAAPVIVDAVRAGGEPVIAVTHAGTILVGTHPGFTHYHGGGDPAAAADLLTPFAGQSYIFRSTDNGTTWAPVGLPAAPGGIGPRGPGLGVSDPEFTVMEDGTVCFTDLEALAAASTSCSTDDGVTWTTGNPVASGGAVDRQWLASHGTELYFTANYFASQADFRASMDRGLTWEDRGATPCNGDVVANPANGHLYQGCGGTAMTVSTDGGRTWSPPVGPDDASAGRGGTFAEPALDAAGNLWLTWNEDEEELWLAGTPDEGRTWPWVIDLTPHARLFAATRQAAPDADGAAPANGTFVWPWISAGSAGRVAVTWIGADGDVPSNRFDGDWHVYSAFVLDAHTRRPTVAVVQLTPEPIHHGPICQSGTGCQVSSVGGAPSGDRRLGDFFETTIEPGTGFLLGAWSNTYADADAAVSHPQFVRQSGGISLLAPEDRTAFRPTQG